MSRARPASARPHRRHRDDPPFGEVRGVPGRVSVSVVGLDNRDYLQACFEHVAGQRPGAHWGGDVEVHYLDNGSQDGSADYVERAFPWVHVLRSPRNLGFAGGHNVGFARTTGEFVLVLNTDIELDPDFLDRAVAGFADPRTGAVQGKLLRIRDGRRLREIENAGHALERGRMARQRGAEDPDDGRWDRDEWVFSVNGACPVYRRAMLEDVAFRDIPGSDGTGGLGPAVGLPPVPEVFDGDYLIYSEDLDLDWRARSRGWRCRYLHRAVAWHWRGATRLRRPTFFAARSYRNRWLTVLKNDRARDLVADLPAVVRRHAGPLRRAAAEGFLAAAVLQGVRVLPRMWRKRRQVQARRRVPAADLVRWMDDGTGGGGREEPS